MTGRCGSESSCIHVVHPEGSLYVRITADADPGTLLLPALAEFVAFVADVKAGRYDEMIKDGE